MRFRGCLWKVFVRDRVKTKGSKKDPWNQKYTKRGRETET